MSGSLFFTDADFEPQLETPTTFAPDTDFETHISQVRRLVTSSCDTIRSPGARHGPLVIVGEAGIGKSTFLSQIFTHCADWSGSEYEATYRIVRNCGQSPSSTYPSELILSLAKQISIVYEFDVVADVVCEIGSLSNWLQECLKLVEAITETKLIIILDDIHNLKSVQTSALLGWLPWSLPSNVHLIFSVDSNAGSVLSILRSRIPADNFVTLNGLQTSTACVNTIACKLLDNKQTLTTTQWTIVREHIDSIYERKQSLTPLYATLLSSTTLSKWSTSSTSPSTSTIDVSERCKLPETVNAIVYTILDELHQQFDSNVINKLCSYLTYTRYGLQECEIADLISAELSDETASKEASAELWAAIKNKLRPLLRSYYVLSRPYLAWCHETIGDAIKARNGPSCKAIHAELSLAFHAGFCESFKSGEECKSTSENEVSNLIREMDELWYQLLQSGDIIKLKACALFNCDFLIASVNFASISYLRSILELVRGAILDYEIELLYTMTKHSVQVVTADPDQLATEILMWLRPFSTNHQINANQTLQLHNGTTGAAPLTIQSPTEFVASILAMDRSEVLAKTLFIDKLLVDTRQACLKKSQPFLIPTNAWLSLPIASQLAAITCPWSSIARAVITKDNQNLIACQAKSIRVFNLSSRNTINTFEGHRGNITCLHLSENGSFLATGSDDRSIAIWELISLEKGEFKLKHQLNHHKSGVLCVTFTRSAQYIISGSEMGAITVASVKSGKLAKQLEPHKGMVTCIKVNNGDDVFATASTDCSIIIWSRDNFEALNTIFLPKPIYHMDISIDSTFLMAACQDNRIHIHALTTGSEVHLLEKHPNNAVVSFLKFAEDSCRAVVGCGDGKVYIYDVHSAKLTATLGAHSEMITSIITTPSDRFLLTAGGNKVIIWNFSPKARYIPIAPPSDRHSTVNKENVSGNTSASTAATSYQQYSRPPSKRARRVDNHREPITCVAVSRDGIQAVTGSRDSLVKIWTLATGETQSTLEGHTSAVSCVAFAPNGNFCVSGSDDCTVRVWTLKLGCYVSCYREHHAKIVGLFVSSDSKKILSCDQNGIHRLWVADTGVNLMQTTKPIKSIQLNANHVFYTCGKNENMVKYYSVYEPEAEKSVTHSDTINCYTVTYDGQSIITGSADMSLKVWEVASAKITQVLVQHEGPIMCVGTAALATSLVISGSQDHDAIIWDMTTGVAMFTLTGHKASVTIVKLNLDGSLAITGGEDNIILLWNAKGERIAMLDIHHSFSAMSTSLNSSQFTLQLVNNQIVPIINLHNNPAQDKTIELPAGTPSAADSEKPFPAWRGIIPGVHNVKKPGLFGRSLRREQSFDSFYFDQLNRGVSVDDFRKLSALASSPAGSREHLATAGIICDGSEADRRGSGGQSSSPSSSVSGSLLSRALPRMTMSKLGPKSKMLKKQQSMLAFFPEHGPMSGSMSSLVRTQAATCPFTGGTVTTSVTTKIDPPFIFEQKKRSLQEQRVRSGLPSRSQSLEEHEEAENQVTTSTPVSPKHQSPSKSLVTSPSKLAKPTQQQTSATMIRPKSIDVHDSTTCIIS